MPGDQTVSKRGFALDLMCGYLQVPLSTWATSFCDRGKLLRGCQAESLLHYVDVCCEASLFSSADFPCKQKVA